MILSCSSLNLSISPFDVRAKLAADSSLSQQIIKYAPPTSLTNSPNFSQSTGDGKRSFTLCTDFNLFNDIATASLMSFHDPSLKSNIDRKPFLAFPSSELIILAVSNDNALLYRSSLSFLISILYLSRSFNKVYLKHCCKKNIDKAKTAMTLVNPSSIE